LLELQVDPEELVKLYENGVLEDMVLIRPEGPGAPIPAAHGV
jgi:hypothetical protein